MYRLDHLEPGEYSLRVRVIGTRRFPDPEPVKVTVRPGETTRADDLVLERDH